MGRVWSVLTDCKNKRCLKTPFTGYDAGSLQRPAPCRGPRGFGGEGLNHCHSWHLEAPLAVYDTRSPQHYCRREVPACPGSSKVPHGTRNRCSVNAAWTELHHQSCYGELSEVSSPSLLLNLLQHMSSELSLPNKKYFPKSRRRKGGNPQEPRLRSPRGASWARGR